MGEILVVDDVGGVIGAAETIKSVVQSCAGRAYPVALLDQLRQSAKPVVDQQDHANPRGAWAALLIALAIW
jgi:hypothetical protein